MVGPEVVVAGLAHALRVLLKGFAVGAIALGAALLALPAIAQQYGPPDAEAPAVWLGDFAFDDLVVAEGEGPFEVYICLDIGCFYAGGAEVEPFVWDTYCPEPQCSYWTVAVGGSDPGPGPVDPVAVAAQDAASAAASAAQAAESISAGVVGVLGLLFGALAFGGYFVGSRDA